ncbi:uncharacterized protein Dsimw501_GD27268 [Drosophila simulans]|uniref:Uncharacterized protein n=1 Tax=Drosophila simulans TaxID=7240 RepID=A0A0J9QXN8_DROSI|nr:uncharacterized protein Dsimw501_GD27268 [Drosophila simulans]
MKQFLIVLLGIVLQTADVASVHISICNQIGSPNLESQLNAFGDILNEKLESFEQRVKQLEIQQNTFLETLNARLENQPIQKSTGQNEGAQSLDKRTKEWNLSPSYTEVVDRLEAYESTTDTKTFVTEKSIEDPVNFDRKTANMSLLKFINMYMARMKQLNQGSSTERTTESTIESTTTDSTTESFIESTTESTSTIESESTDATEEPPQFDGSSPYEFMIDYMLRELKDVEESDLPNSKYSLQEFVNKAMEDYKKWMKLEVN